MESMKENIQNSQAGTGSAEQTGRERSEQQQPATHLTPSDKHNVASQIGEKENAVSSIGELGGLRGRDDSAGGSGDRMEGESTGEGTDR